MLSTSWTRPQPSLVRVVAGTKRWSSVSSVAAQVSGRLVEERASWERETPVGGSPSDTQNPGAALAAAWVWRKLGEAERVRQTSSQRWAAAGKCLR